MTIRALTLFSSIILLLSGEGYSLTWKEGAEKRTRVDWHEGTVFVPPIY